MKQQSSSRNGFAKGLLTVVILLALAGIILLGLKTIFSSEVSEHDPDLIPFATNQNYETFSTAEVQQALLEICTNQPEVLASTISAFPSVITEVAGISETDPIALDDLMDGEDGADVQLSLLRALRLLLENPGVSYQYGNYTGTGDLLCLRARDPNADPSPSNLELVWTQFEMKNTKILTITANYDDRIKETGYFYLAGGFQRFKPTNGSLR